MIRHTTSPTPSPSGPRRRAAAALAVVGLAIVSLGACSGDDEEAATSSTTDTLVAADTTTTTQAATTTTTTTTPPTTIAYVTEGATVVVANSSSINGAAGRMTARLQSAGFTTGEATNGSEGVLETTKIYFDPSNESAQAVAESLRQALGGGDIGLNEMGVPAPVESGDVGDATVVVSMGNDVADQTLEALQGVAPAPADSTTDSTTGTSDATGDSSPDTTAADG